uniref:Uncharacterized protein n=1 Tax=Oryza glumipatula TaxID=40148 RepID=A0A0D9ZR69_9ORYZ
MTVVLRLLQMYLPDADSFSATNTSARQRSSTFSPDSKESIAETLVAAVGVGAAPKVNTGNTNVTQAGGFSLVRYSTSDQESSSRTWPSPCSGLPETAAADDVRITRFTVPALTHDLITFMDPGALVSWQPWKERNFWVFDSVLSSVPVVLESILSEGHLCILMSAEAIYPFPPVTHAVFISTADISSGGHAGYFDPSQSA